MISLTELQTLTLQYQSCKGSRQAALKTLQQSQAQVRKLQEQSKILQAQSIQLSDNLQRERQQTQSLQQSFSALKIAAQSTISTQTGEIAAQKMQLQKVRTLRNYLIIALVVLAVLIVAYVILKIRGMIPF